jgi:hypothetical protein
MLLPLNYNSNHLPPAVRKLKPVLFKEGDGYGCYYGLDPEKGLAVYTDSPSKAIQDWNILYQFINRLDPEWKEKVNGILPMPDDYWEQFYKAIKKAIRYLK